ncbi:hypothetical protein MHSWG343_07260 [Candidatus Mycoplasma haematohominis]|uniref:Uncharacterized protein n=1 Tax=Candidatus Mycoplasma haematohominis TaxID=1494318 RepID=A0A478FTQ6_9MOLU|nr:hypothetical protein MHSWG343_07260 [Candidatus Mycoplasma haemohominis]
MSTQAIGAVAVGTAVVGGGGTLAAYAAGAFNGEAKYESFEDYVNKALKNKKQYSADSLTNEKIKQKLSTNTYKEELKKVVVKTEDSDPITAEDVGKNPPDDNKLTKMVEKAKAWCTSKKPKKSIDGGKWTKVTIEKDADWAPFEAVCLEPVPSS